MTARKRLTKRLVDDADSGPKDRFLWDSEVVGFGVKLNVKGRKTYIAQYRVAGRSRRFTIGGHGSPWTVETARERAKVLLGKVADGQDPQESKTLDRNAMTVAQMCELYLTEGLATRKAASVATARADLDNHIKPRIGAKRAVDVTPEDIDRLLLEIAAGKTARRAKTSKKRGVSMVRGGKGAANSAISTLGAAFGFAIRRRVRLDNPVRGVRKFRERKLERFLSPAELARLGEALAAAESLGVESPFAIAAIRLLVLTGARRNEVLGLERAWIDAHNSCLRLPDSKTGAKVIHLGEAALEVIQAVPGIVGNPYLLPGRGQRGPLRDIQSAWTRIRDAAGLPDVRLHDLRHAFASLGVGNGDTLFVVGSLLGHRSPQTTHRYAHLADHPLKSAADRISAEAARLMALRRPEGKDARARANVVAAPPGTRGVLGEVIATEWLDTLAAAQIVGSTVGTLQTWRWMGLGPPYRRVGRRIVYARGDVDAWKTEQDSARADGRLSRTQVA
ncbi:MAG TPA: tyrosine-type recombinase/integrase [Caulobacteraceae bacterium]